jgi:hypothetical protein
MVEDASPTVGRTLVMGSDRSHGSGHGRGRTLDTEVAKQRQATAPGKTRQKELGYAALRSPRVTPTPTPTGRPTTSTKTR